MGQNRWRNFLFFQAIAVQVCTTCSTASGALSKPTISLMLPNGTLINSGHAEIPRGSSFVINCSVDSSTNFTMIHNNISIYKNPATFNISMADYKHAGNYYCLYNISTKTEWINVIVTDSWWTVLFYILPAGILVLLLVVLLVVFLVCRSRRRVVKLNTEIFNQMTVRNSYADEEVEEEEEMDYVNVDSVSSKCLRANQMDEVDNDSHDYEEPDEISGAAEGNREEVSEEEDSSDDEHDYVNLTEQSADICREVDIYNNF